MMQQNPECRSRRISYRLWIVGTLFLTFLVRLYLFLTQQCVSKDGVEYINAAQYYIEGDWSSGLFHGYGPMYPLSTAFMYLITGDWIAAGGIVTILYGTFSIIPLFLLIRQLFASSKYWNEIMIGTLLVYTLLPIPVRLTTQIFSTGCFTFFFLWACWSLVRALRTSHWADFALVAICISLAYFTRADALLLLLVGVCFICTQQIRLGRKEALRFFIACTILCMILMCILLPYILFRSAGQGINIWESISSKVGIQFEHLTIATLFPLLWTYMGTIAHTMHYWLLPFVLIGLIFRKHIPLQGRSERMIICICIAHLTLLLFLYLMRGYLSKRHVVPFVILMIPWIIIGFIELAHRLRRPKMFRILLVVALLSFLPKTFHPLGYGRLGERHAGLFVKEQVDCRARELLSSSICAYFYAFDNIREYESTSSLYHHRDEISDYASLKSYMRTHHISYLLADKNVIKGESVVDPHFFDKVRADPDWQVLFEGFKSDENRRPENRIGVYFLQSTKK